MKRLSRLILLTLLAGVIFTTSCGGGRSGGTTYDEEMTGIINIYKQHQFLAAVNTMGAKTADIMKRVPIDRFVAFLELGKMAIAAKKYDLAIKYLQLAEKRFLNIEGTISISEEVSSIFMDDTTKEYEAEPHELIMISPYLALAYAAKGDYDGAYIERNRAINKIQEYIERTNKRYLENPFSRLLSAVLYEKQGKTEDAKLEYKKIVSRIAFAGSEATKNLAKKNLERIEANKKTKGNLLVFTDIGLSPVKKQAIYERNHHIGGKDVLIKYAYAVLVPRHDNRIKHVKIIVNGKPIGTSVMLYNIENIVMEQFAKNKPKIEKAITDRVAARVMSQVAGNTMGTAGEQVGGAGGTALQIVGGLMSLGAKVSMAIERADTRSWLTLPRFIQVYRVIGLKTGEHNVELQYLGAAGNVIGQAPAKTIKINDENDIAVAHFTAPF